VNDKPNLKFCGRDHVQAVTGASAIIVGTEWDEYANLDYAEVRKIMNPDMACLFDLRSYLNVKAVLEAGFNRVFKLGN